MVKKKVLWQGGILLVIIGLSIAGWLGYDKYRIFLKSNVPASQEEEFVHIPTGSDFKQVLSLLDTMSLILDTASFRSAAEEMNYRGNLVKPGRYRVKPGWNNLELIRYLRSGQQEPVDLVLTNERLPEDVAGKVARFIEADSLALIQLFRDDQYLAAQGLTRETLMSLFIPNTYEFFWNTTAEAFMDRMKREHDNFWKNNDRIEKAARLGLTPEQVYTLASIVEKETNRNDEKSRIAGVYLNRLQRNMLLQADPTCVFATRDFTVKRVLNYHTGFDSPYNTYLYPGLPPGPICMASISSIDAVLNHETHDYLYFCAHPEGNGYHVFAKTLSQHNVNAARYRATLNGRN